MSKMKKKMCRLFSALLCLLILFVALPFSAAAQEKVVRVGWYEDSYNITGENGERSGYAYEYQQTIASYTGWKYEYVKAGWSELVKMLENGEIDLMSGVSYTDARAQKMLFSELPMGMERYYLYGKLGKTGISPADLKTLEGKRVGLLEGSVQATQFYKWEQEHNLHLQHVSILGFEDCKRKLANNEVDCVASTETPLLVELGLANIALIGGSANYFVVNKNRPDLKEELDGAMRKIEQDKPFYADSLYQRYLSAVGASVLVDTEKTWLAQHGAIRMGYVKCDVGVSMLDEKTGKIVGIINDYLNFASHALGNQKLKFELVGFATQAEELQALKDKKVDVLFHVNQNPYAAEQNGFILSNTVWEFNLAAVTAKSNFAENMTNTVAIPEKNLLMKWYVSYNYPQWKIVEYEDFAAAEQAVREGEADCFVSWSTQLAKYLEDKTLHCVFLTQPGNTSFAVNREDTVLMSILNKTLKNMPPAMLTGALAMYDAPAKKVTLLDFIKDNLLLVGICSLAAFAFILVLLRKSRIAEAKAKQAANRAQELNEKLQESHEELEAALLRAEEASSAKTRFLFNMSHDIRTPMNALLGYAKLMKPELTSPKLLDYQAKLEQSGNVLLSIINNVLDMARIESGKLEVDEQYSYAGDILGGVYSVFKEEARKKNITITHTVDVKHKHILCDVTKIQDIYINLVSNAVKYTRVGGTIHIDTVELPSEKEGYVCIKSDIIDNGIGMSKDFLPHIFDSFSRERNTTMAKVAGTGLGMSIVKRLVEMMGGTITVTSEEGRGTTFSVIFEHKIADEAYYNKAAAAVSNEKTKAVLQGKRVLLAEDNDLNAEIATFLLKNMGLEVDRASDGVECVERIKKQPAHFYDIILMDIQMPNMDGYAATRAIRGLEDAAKANIPIIAMTANAFEEDRKRALAEGMNGHIAKPIDVEKVKEMLLEVLR